MAMRLHSKGKITTRTNYSKQDALAVNKKKTSKGCFFVIIFNGARFDKTKRTWRVFGNFPRGVETDNTFQDSLKTRQNSARLTTNALVIKKMDLKESKHSNEYSVTSSPVYISTPVE